MMLGIFQILSHRVYTEMCHQSQNIIYIYLLGDKYFPLENIVFVILYSLNSVTQLTGVSKGFKSEV